jgi:branched-chain amino acid transport system substrate-binding protein
MLATNPDTLYLSTFNYVVGTFMRQVRGFGYRGLILSKEVFTIDQVQVAQHHSNDFIFVAPYVTFSNVEDAHDPIMRQFLADYLAAFGRMPQHDCAFRAWDALLALEAAIKIANSLEKDAIRDAIFRVKDLPVLGGVLDFTVGTGEGMHFVPSFIIQDLNYLPVQAWLDAGGLERHRAQL